MKANILVQYSGGGYEGCYWEWNFCLVDSVEHPTEFQNIYASGRNGAKTLEEFLEKVMGDDFYSYDLTDPERWKEFDREANPGSVVGVSQWLAKHREDLSGCVPLCDRCGKELYEECCLGGWHGQGGIVSAPGNKVCEECDIQDAWESWVRDEIVRSVEEEGLSLDDLSTEDLDKVLWEAVYQAEAYWEGEGDDRHLCGSEDVVERLVEDMEGIRKKALCMDDQLKLSFQD